MHSDHEWSHPRRIEVQATALLADSESVANMSQWVKVTDELVFLRTDSATGLVEPNDSSLMLRRAALDEIGYWDEVSWGAYAELRGRVMAWTGREVAVVGAVPLSLGRVRPGPADAGRSGLPDLPHRWYEQSSSGWHGDLSRNRKRPRRNPRGDGRQFSVPDAMLPLAQRAEHVDVMYGTDFRFPGGNSTIPANEISTLLDEGLTVGLLQLDSPILAVDPKLHPRIRAIANHANCHVYSTSDAVDADLLIIRHPTVLQYARPEASNISPKTSCLIVNHTPRLRDGSGAVYDLVRCAEIAATIFGPVPSIVPESGVIRDRINEVVPGLALCSFDWPGCLRLTAQPPRHAQPSRKPIIGRHSRDSTEKWPESLDALTAAYPVDGSRKVRILGGAKKTAARDQPELIAAWTVYPHGFRDVNEFLAGIDFWVYFHAETTMESFGMAIAEAMASGAVVILPEYMRATFGPAALYATPHEVQKLIDHYWHEQPDPYRAQSERGIRLAATRFSPEAFLSRVRQLIGTPGPSHSSSSHPEPLCVAIVEFLPVERRQ